MDDFGTLETGFNAEFGSEANTATTDYDALVNKPSINGVELSGDKSTEDLGIEIPAEERLLPELNINSDAWKVMRAWKSSQFGQPEIAWAKTEAILEFAFITLENDYSAARSFEVPEYTDFMMRGNLRTTIVAKAGAYIRCATANGQHYHFLYLTGYDEITKIATFEGTITVNGKPKKMVVTIGYNSADDSYNLYDVFDSSDYYDKTQIDNMLIMDISNTVFGGE